MKKLSIYILSVLALLAFASCTADTDNDNDKGGNGKVRVRINISSSGISSASRASGDLSWHDENVEPGEKMKNCFVVIVQKGKIIDLLKSEEYTTEQDYVGTLESTLDEGETTFYSFANISPEELDLNPSPKYYSESNPKKPFPTDFDSKLYAVAGNVGAAIVKPADGEPWRKNVFPKGIPMSNKQTFTIKKTTQQVDLEVIRMVAKIKLKLTNDTRKEITLKSISLTDITDNGSKGAENLYLLPGVDNGTAVEPHISPSATSSKYTVKLWSKVGETEQSGLKIPAKPATSTATPQTPVEVTLYLNESVAKSPKYFILNMETDNLAINRRITLAKWDVMARNDYLEVPIKLSDYQITFDVQQFTAIGVLPSISQVDDKLTVKFKNYGEFHLVPHVKKYSTGIELVGGSDAVGSWTVAGWSTIKQDPDGADGVSIYDRSPKNAPKRLTIDGVMGNRPGYAVHEILIHIGGLGYNIPYRVEIIKE